MKITRPERKFVEQNLSIDAWEKIERYYTDLLNRDISNKDNFVQWLQDISELEAILEEDMAWRYIKMSINTKDETLSNNYTFFVTEIQPKLAPLEDQLNRMLTASPFTQELKEDSAYAILLRSIENALNLYREENIPIQAELAEESQKYGALSAAQSIEHDGETITMQRAALYLKETDEALRKEVFEKMGNRRREDFDKFDELFESLLKKRHQVALNAGFDNFRDYKLQAMGRFDYSVQDCRDFHQSVKSTIVPIVKELQQERLNKLGKDKFKPWDLDVDPKGKLPLKPFQKGADLLNGSIKMFNRVDPYFGDCLATMSEMGHLDLESKDGKSPGGYNYPLYEIGVPFIFMNAVGSQRDLVTMVHEGGHAVHSFLSRELEITGFKSLPSEVAELASMAMELLTMDQWHEFYANEDDLKRAKKEQLETILRLLPWIAQVDEFQHWLYENHDHTAEQRHKYWVELSTQYGTGLTDWTGYEDLQRTSWQRQLHIFEVPFYYIEYGIAQLGALGVWKNSLEDKPKAIQSYKNALKLGYTRSIPEIYAAAGVEFNFTEANITSLASFVQTQLEALK
ncbi:M3 family oligoendopeptidase [Crocinitomicaceae bacterium]|nr:M3 family oligoendopeptidase [Crocinitomicaceae bacterium]MDB3906679.1 M3 family oligoendopeptidase [Crocinitomicaceae bacterium]MDC0257640.1 M3 family oligoendopeptidase [Crocinitomicaceae bacterium]